MILKILMCIMINVANFNSHDVIATYYNPTVNQCDSNPLITADGSKINLDKLKKKQIRWIAVSRDLLDHYKYGDKVLVRSNNKVLNGVWIVKDTMNKRHKRRIDILTHEKNLLDKPVKVKIYKLP